MRRFFLAMSMAVLGALLWAGAAGAQSAKVSRIDVVDYGIYTMDGTGKRDTVGNVRHAVPTTSIPAQIGVRFGLNYLIVGTPEGGAMTLRHITIVPPPGITDPKTGKTLTRSVYDVTHKIGETSFVGYGLDQPWELVPGVWTFEIWDGQRKLLSRSFTVVK